MKLNREKEKKENSVEGKGGKGKKDVLIKIVEGTCFAGKFGVFYLRVTIFRSFRRPREQRVFPSSET